MIGSTAGFAAAANFPSGFTSTTPAIVYGAAAPPSDDLTSANTISSYLAGKVSSSGTPTGDSLVIGKSSDHLNINNTWAVLTGTIDGDDLSTLLADGTYAAADSDTYDYEQSIVLGKPELKHFRDSDYEEAAGLSDKTPIVGFNIPSSTWVMNYTLEFTSDVESDLVSGELADVETSIIPLLGKEYYVSDFDNTTSSGSLYFGKVTLLDSAEVGTVSEGETITVGGHEVGISYIDSNEVKFIVDGVTVPANDKLEIGETHKLSDGSFIGVRDISKLEVSGETGSASFSIGSGKLEITSGSDIELNDDTITGLKGFVYAASGDRSTTAKIDKLVIEWKTDEEAFISPTVDLVMPGFEAVKFTMNDLVRPEEEKITVSKDSDTSIELALPIKDGDVNFDILYSNATGDLVGFGKSATERLATSPNATLKFFEKLDNADWHEYFVASYATTTDSESYLLRAKVNYDSGDNRNETTIDKNADGSWTEVCTGKVAGDDCDLGDVTFTITSIQYISGGNETALFTAGSNVVFDEIYTAGGLKIQLPYLDAGLNNTGAFSAGLGGSHDIYTVSVGAATGHGLGSFFLGFYDEDKDDNVAAGDTFNVTIDDTADNNLQVSQVNAAGSGGSAINGVQDAGLEIGDSSTYEAYIKDDVSARILHYTNPDEDYVEIFYPTGESETYAEVFIAEGSSTTGEAGNMIYRDTETGWKSMNAILVGGSCVNTATAEALGVPSGTCGSDWVAKTSVGENKYLIQIIADKFSDGKIALIAAGYSAADTKAAASKLVDPASEIDTTAGNAYIYSVGATGTDICVSGC